MIPQASRKLAPIVRRRVSMLKEFMEFEASGGIVLMGAAVVALIIANSAAADAYFSLLQRHIGPLSILHWINDGLMAVFFLLVGLEIKHELTRGALVTTRQRMLPGFGALAGMAAPALVYVAINLQRPELLRGWAIPSATDIAFALGILSLLGSRVPSSLHVFLAALAIIDDLGAVIVIAVFYGTGLKWGFLAGAALVVALLVALNRSNVSALWPYIGLGLLLWILIHGSGLHATLSGVILAFCVPLSIPRGKMAVESEADEESEDSPLHRLENKLDRVVPFVIMPIFGFANAGVSFRGVNAELLTDSLTLGVGLGLLLGKAIGICGITFVLIRMGKASLPVGSTWTQFVGLSFLCGIGFTMSLFISMLAFAGTPLLQEEAKIGILLGSLISGTVGAIILKSASK